jgi:hypothetical protein
MRLKRSGRPACQLSACSPLAMTPTPKQSAQFLLMNGLKFGEERKTHHVQAVVAPKNRKSVRTLAESSRSHANYRWTNSLSLRSASFESLVTAGLDGDAKTYHQLLERLVAVASA